MIGGWLITKDLIEDGKREGTLGPRGIDPAIEKRLQNGEGKKFRMKDDDGEVYYQGRNIEGDDSRTEPGFEPLDDFGAPNAGCTQIEYWEGGWKPL